MLKGVTVAKGVHYRRRFSALLESLPTSLVVRTFSSRAAKLWAILRVALSAVFLLAGNDPLHLSLMTVITIVGLSAFLATVDIRRNREMVFLSNLGISRSILAGMICLPAMLGEAALFALVALL